MKKLFVFISVVVFTAFCLSCSSDDKPEPKPEVKKLVLSSNAIDGKVGLGDEIIFTVKVGDEVINDATILATNGVVVKEGKFITSEFLKYSFIAKKEGFVDSNMLDVDVDVKLENAYVFDNEVHEVGEAYVAYIGKTELPGKGEKMYGKWFIRSVDKSNTIKIEVHFAMPLSAEGSEEFSDGSEVTPLKIVVFEYDEMNTEWLKINNLGFKNTVIDLNLKIKESKLYEGSFKTSANYKGYKKLKIDYTGEFFYYDPMLDPEYE